MKKLVFIAVLLYAMPCSWLNAFATDVVSVCQDCDKSECDKWSYISDCCISCRLPVGPVEPVLECITDSDCYSDDVAPDGVWVSTADGVGEYTNVIACVDSQCVDSKKYRCVAGDYGTLGEDFFGCWHCPSGGTSIAGSNESITDCYVTEFSDDTGSGIYTDKCYYDNSDSEIGGGVVEVGGGEVVVP